MPQEYSVAEERALAAIFEECAEAMENGERDLDNLASRYPWARDEIRSLLDISLALLQRAALSRHIRAGLRA